MIQARCGVRDGSGKLCNRPVTYREFRFFVAGRCEKHGLIALARDRFQRALEEGKSVVHLDRGSGYKKRRDDVRVAQLHWEDRERVARRFDDE